MTITITKEGYIPVPPKYRGRCGNCKTEFKCDSEDTFSDTNARERKYNTLTKYVTCPLCNKRVAVMKAKP